MLSYLFKTVKSLEVTKCYSANEMYINAIWNNNYYGCYVNRCISNMYSCEMQGILPLNDYCLMLSE